MTRTKAIAVIAVIAVCVVMMTACTAKIDYGRNTQFYADKDVTLGEYPRTEVSKELGAELESAYMAGSIAEIDGYYPYGGEKYARVTVTNTYAADDPENTDADFFRFTRYEVGTVHWFRVEPIQWRVLNTQHGLAVLMANELLYATSYCGTDTDGHLWETSHLRAYLNEDFLNAAFNGEERSLLVATETECAYISNPGRYKYTRGTVKDYVRTLTWKEVNLKGHFEDEQARTAQVTDYAAALGGARVTKAMIEENYPELDPADYEPYYGCGIYWLTDTELDAQNVYIVYEFGNLLSYNANIGNRTVRPVICIKEKSLRNF